MDTYEVGDQILQIQLAVDIFTTGLAATRAILVETSSTTPAVSVAHSNDATGDVTKVAIGFPDSLHNKRLSVFTKIDLISDDLQARKMEFEHLNAKYTMFSGAEGSKEFGSPANSVDSDYRTAFMQKHIDLI